MSRKKIFLILTILWMILIFYLSNQPASVSSAQSGEVIDILKSIPIIREVLSALLSSDIVESVIRRSAHMFIYFILAILVFNYIYDKNKLLIKSMSSSLLVTFLYACTDELHQLFIPGRSGELRDIIIDSIGAIIGLILIYIFIKIKDNCNEKL